MHALTSPETPVSLLDSPKAAMTSWSAQLHKRVSGAAYSVDRI